MIERNTPTPFELRRAELDALFLRGAISHNEYAAELRMAAGLVPMPSEEVGCKKSTQS